jgi:putative holliday junction resolvase
VRHGRVLGIDAGERRVGVALSDELRLLARPVAVLDRAAGLAPVLDALTELARREGVASMVVGLPLNADGSVGRQAKRARDFARVAARVVGIPVELWDERLSTREAESIAREQGRNMRRLRQRGHLDALAAAVILQDYLDHRLPVSPSDSSERSASASDRSRGRPSDGTERRDSSDDLTGRGAGVDG